MLVLGGNGFLGRHLVRALCMRGADVRVFDRGLQQHASGNIVYCQGDLASGQGLDEALEGVDVVYHLISTTIPSTSNANPAFDVESNLLGTLGLLDKMKAAGVRKIVFTSSGGTVYGNPRQVPVPEDAPLEPISSYGIVKVAIEQYLRLHATLHQFDAAVLRLSNPYGLGETRIGVHGVIPTFFTKTLAREPIEVWGDGTVVRDYLHVDDAVKALVLASEWPGFRLYNVGSGAGHSLLDILNTIKNVSGMDPDVVFHPPRSFDVKATYLDITRITSETSWRPTIDLEQGCRMFWESFKA
ncbi:MULTISPECIES: NAD-dependent epimerase/dehydratase family protein [unclassified Caballeronia]|uniref:NAD-dependent epimerase/dehydratase family protein n=1 Tax=unclassified Caballeronia TaxID=2646786 RepID=UPI002854E066|nr:NAD-dependent epimerase/dehydratase family protein [Caballeronia sp. LZ001]MDR5804190.1 NAD-dependent epimerase/dehydratase family protein [Caballeronia sp. LZ001]